MTLTTKQRIPYETSETEQRALDGIKTHLQLALGKCHTVTTADALTYSVLMALTLLEECQYYWEAMPSREVAMTTRLGRLLEGTPVC